MAGNTLSQAVVEVHMWVLCWTTSASNTVAGAGAKKSEAAAENSQKWMTGAENSRHSGAAGGAEEMNWARNCVHFSIWQPAGYWVKREDEGKKTVCEIQGGSGGVGPPDWPMRPPESLFLIFQKAKSKLCMIVTNDH